MTKFTDAMARISADLSRARGADMMKADPPGGGRIVANGLVGEAGSDPEHTMSADAFLEKAMTAVGKGLITSAQLTEAELCLRAGKLPPKGIVKAVINSAPYWPF